MDCNSARLLLEFSGPENSELDSPEAAALADHLLDCPVCQRFAQAAKQFDDVLGRAMTAVQVPDGLRDRLVGKLKTEGNVSLRRTAIKVAIAAAVLLGAGLGGWAWLQNWKVGLNIAALSEQVDEPILKPTKDNTDAWLKRVGGGNLAASADFDYSMLIQRDVVLLNGRQVPQLRFRGKNERAFANVYVLDDAVYDLPSIKKQIESLDNSGAFREVKIAVHEDQLYPNILYLIFYRGMELKHFIKVQP